MPEESHKTVRVRSAITIATPRAKARRRCRRATGEEPVLATEVPPVACAGFLGASAGACGHGWRSQTPMFWPPFPKLDGLISTSAEAVPSMVAMSLLVVHGPRMVPCAPV